MKERLSRIKAPWRRLILSLVMACLVVLSRIKSPRAKIHWIGAHDRPRRRERALIGLLMLVSALVFEPQQYLLWAASWGGAASLYIILHSLLIMARSSSSIAGNWFDGDEDL